MKTISLLLLGFLASSAHAFTISQNFDTLTDGSPCGWDAAGNSKVTSEKAYSGTKGCKLSVTQGDTAFGTWGGIINHPQKIGRYGEIWFRVRTFMPVGFNYDSIGEGGHLKFLRIHTSSDAQENKGYDDMYLNIKGATPPYMFIYEGEQVWDFIGSATGTLTNVVAGPSSHAITFGTWETFEFYVKLDTVPVDKGGQARVRFWKNGSLMADITDRITISSAEVYSDRSHIFTYWNGGSPQTQSMYVDDVVITSDMPSARDAAGNPYIGASGLAPVIPKPPTGITIQ